MLYHTIMKTRTNKAMKELRKIVGRTQGEFAAMIGASKDAVASWETGRNKLSRQFAWRIAFATRVGEEALLRGRGALRCYVPFACLLMGFKDDPTKVGSGEFTTATANGTDRGCRLE